MKENGERNIEKGRLKEKRRENDLQGKIAERWSTVFDYFLPSFWKKKINKKSYIFRDRPSDRTTEKQTDGHALLYRCVDASKNQSMWGRVTECGWEKKQRERRLFGYIKPVSGCNVISRKDFDWSSKLSNSIWISKLLHERIFPPRKFLAKKRRISFAQWVLQGFELAAVSSWLYSTRG